MKVSPFTLRGIILNCKQRHNKSVFNLREQFETTLRNTYGLGINVNTWQKSVTSLLMTLSQKFKMLFKSIKQPSRPLPFVTCNTVSPALFSVAFCGEHGKPGENHTPWTYHHSLAWVKQKALHKYHTHSHRYLEILQRKTHWAHNYPASRRKHDIQFLLPDLPNKNKAKFK